MGLQPEPQWRKVSRFKARRLYHSATECVRAYACVLVRVRANACVLVRVRECARVCAHGVVFYVAFNNSQSYHDGGSLLYETFVSGVLSADMSILALPVDADTRHE